MNDEKVEEILKSFEVDRLLKLMALHSRKHHAGHFTIFSFTTGYKAGFGTPDMHSGGGYLQVLKMTPHERLKDALVDALSNEKHFHQYWAGGYKDLIKEMGWDK